MNKYILSILKKMVKSPDTMRKTKISTESKKEIISNLTKKTQKIKVDQHFKDLDINDFHIGTHSLVSWFSTLSFKKTSF